MFLVMTLLLTTFISRGITIPIFKLLQHQRRVETGHLGEIIEPVEANEIGAVQQGFNQMTQALQANRKLLDDRIHNATGQLSNAITKLEVKNRELGLARDEAQDANRIKSEFLANMSHEIRTPINGIKGFINLMEQTELSSRQKRYADIILKSTNDLINIIEEILDFSKLESGKLQIIEDDFDLYEVLEQTRDILFITIINKNIDLILIIYSDTPRYVCGDKLRLKQVLINLIGNAIKFTDQGQVIVKVSLNDEMDGEARISIQIEDSGIGISDEDQNLLFTAFTQVDSAANRRYSGSGLGLVISKDLVNLMGGDISMESEPGKGSLFAVQLPLAVLRGIGQVSELMAAEKTALIFASKATCLQEIQTLFDRAQTATECVFVKASQTVDNILSTINTNIRNIDLIVFDLRHLKHNMDEILARLVDCPVNIILMHYDQSMLPELNNSNYEFCSNIITSASLRSTLYADSEPENDLTLTTVSSTTEQAKRVLLVDDNPINLKLAGELLRLWGHKTVEAKNAHDAMKHYQDELFELIILDIQMPDIDGIELLNMMRTEKPDDRTPIIALTANELTTNDLNSSSAGFDGYLRKPIEELKFKRVLDGNLKAADKVTDSVKPSKPSGNFKTFNYEESLSHALDNEDILRQIIEILMREIPQHQQQMKVAFEEANHASISATLHKLQGITCYISLPKLKQLVLETQVCLSKESNRELGEKIHAVIVELEAIKLEVLTLLDVDHH